MAKPRTETKRQSDRDKISRLLLEGRTFNQIKQQTGLANGTLSADLAALRTAMVNASRQRMDELVALEAARFDMVLAGQFEELARMSTAAARAAQWESIARTIGRKCRSLGLSIPAQVRELEQRSYDAYCHGRTAVMDAVLAEVTDPDVLARITNRVENDGSPLLTDGQEIG